MDHHVIDKMKMLSTPDRFQDGEPCTIITHEHVAALAAEFGLGGRRIEILALENGVIPLRYSRNMRSFDLSDQAALLKSRVGVIGLGGLGGSVTEILARVGVGRLRLLDGDRFEEHNLNRQLLSGQSGLSTPKAEAAASRVREINPSVEVETHAQFLTEENAEKMLANLDVVVDCLDTITARFLLEKFAKKAGVPLVSAAIAGTSGQLITIFPGDEGLSLIHGAPETLPPKGVETTLGCLPYTVMYMASLEAAEVVKVLHGKGSILRNRLLVADLADHTHEVLELL